MENELEAGARQRQEQKWVEGHGGDPVGGDRHLEGWGKKWCVKGVKGE